MATVPLGGLGRVRAGVAAVATGLIILILVAGIVIYSLAWKKWCMQYEAEWNSKIWGDASFSDRCIKEKSVFSF